MNTPERTVRSGRPTNWGYVLQAAGLTAKRRSSGSRVMRCVFHDEKSPSLFFWPNGSFLCFGCKAGSTITDFIEMYGLRNLDEDRLYDPDPLDPPATGPTLFPM